MKMDTQKLKESNDVVLQADKTRNMYLIKPDKYKEKLLENITTNYKKTRKKAD